MPSEQRRPKNSPGDRHRCRRCAASPSSSDANTGRVNVLEIVRV
jgi:hypothetical protein